MYSSIVLMMSERKSIRRKMKLKIYISNRAGKV
jgi:hypothetical protein